MRMFALLVALVALVALPTFAQAEDQVERPAPWFYVRARAAVQFFPLGLQAELNAQPRTALHRSKSILFGNTYIGGGAYLRATPAFLEVGPKFSVYPIDILEFEASALAVYHWKSTNGRVPFDTIANKTYADRQVHPYESEGVFTFIARLTGVLKAKVGPLIVVYGATVDYNHLFTDAADDQLLYDAGLDLLINKRDWTVHHQGAVLAEVLDGVKVAPRLRLGGSIRHRLALGTKDKTFNAGFMGLVKPGRKPGWPEIGVLVMPYIMDTDRVVPGPPWMALLLTWELNPTLRGKGKGKGTAASQAAASVMRVHGLGEGLAR